MPEVLFLIELDSCTDNCLLVYLPECLGWLFCVRLALLRAGYPSLLKQILFLLTDGSTEVSHSALD